MKAPQWVARPVPTADVRSSVDRVGLSVRPGCSLFVARTPAPVLPGQWNCLSYDRYGHRELSPSNAPAVTLRPNGARWNHKDVAIRDVRTHAVLGSFRVWVAPSHDINSHLPR